MTWTKVDIGSANAMEEAIAFCRLVMKQSSQANFRNDLEWVVRIAGESSVVLIADPDVPAFGLAFRRIRPLRFPQGGFVLFKKDIHRLELGAGPVIASEGLSEDEVANIEKQYLAAIYRELLPGEVLCFEGLPTASRLHKMIVDDAETCQHFLVLYLQKPYMHHFARLPESFEAYLRQLGTRSRKSVQYSRSVLIREYKGNVAAVCFSTVHEVERFLDNAVEISKKTYQWQLLGLGLRNRESLKGLYQFMAKRGWLRCYILYCTNVPVAFMVGYHYEDCFFYIDVGYDPRWARYSVGSVLQLEVMEDLYRRGNTPVLFDFSTGYGPHKSRFGKEAREEVNMLLLPKTPGNRVLALAFRSVEGMLDVTSRSLDKYGLKQSLRRAIRRVKSGKRTSGEP